MKIRIFLIVVFCGWSVCAQQEPHYTQYMYNMGMVNPAYMIHTPHIVEVGSLYRAQWVGVEGAPKTANVFANLPLNSKMELSVNYLNDNIGGNINISENVFNVDLAYKIKLNPDLNLSFGLKTGIDHLNFSAIGSNVGTDPAYGNTSKTVLNIGTGAFLFGNNFYAGLSSPNVIPSNLGINNETVYNNNLHVFLIGGYVFGLGTDFKLKPSTVVKYVGGAPLSFDVATNVLYQDRFEIGLSYRYQDAVAALASIYITPSLKLGYAYDFNTNKLKTFNNGSHELILLYRFDVLGLSKQYSSPRFY